MPWLGWLAGCPVLKLCPPTCRWLCQKAKCGIDRLTVFLTIFSIRDQDADSVGDTLVSQPGTMHSTSGLAASSKVHILRPLLILQCLA